MNTRTVDPRTVWAILAMEAGLALPLISLPTQGDRLPGLLGPVLLAILLPLGYVAVYQIRDLRDPSWRLLSGIGLALATRGIVSIVPEPGVPGLAIWLGRSVVPMAIGIGLWWRGSALSVAELTAGDVRTEFSILAVCMLAVLSMVRPFLLPDPALLAGSVALFAVGGLVATALARQDAAEVASVRFGRTLATASALAPAAAAVILVTILRPALLGAMWNMLARIIELIFTPIGWLIAWLASLFPRGEVQPQPLPPRPTQAPMPDPAALGQLQDRQEWLGWLVLFTLLVLASIAAMLVVRMLLSHWIGTPLQRSARQPEDLTVEPSGTPGDDAHDFFGWLLRWLRAQLGGRPGPGRTGARATEPLPADAWAAYRSLLEWASSMGLPRRPSETTGQLRERLTTYAPDTASAVDLVTSTYEWDHYGAIQPAANRLRRVQQAIRSLLDR
ncbi:MAG TPA: DUF4129 domain-containing protein [Chloroflexota bacterium]|nr:DUF4129 domain-containing protein [Chloroflexota bacterium]